MNLHQITLLLSQIQNIFHFTLKWMEWMGKIVYVHLYTLRRVNNKSTFSVFSCLICVAHTHTDTMLLWKTFAQTYYATYDYDYINYNLIIICVCTQHRTHIHIHIQYNTLLYITWCSIPCVLVLFQMVEKTKHKAKQIQL